MASGSPLSAPNSASSTLPGDELKAALLAHLGGPYQPPVAVTVSATVPQTNPATAGSTPAASVSLTARALAVQPYGCALEEIELQAPHLTNASMDILKKWANALCQKVTYLLESLGPLEFDVDGQEVLIRSMPPSPLPSSKRYYEIRLSTLGAGKFLLGRYEANPGQPRQRQPLELGMEQVVRLGNDLVATLPESP